MNNNLLEKQVLVPLESPIPLVIRDSEGKVIGTANVEGSVLMSFVVQKNHPSALDLETGNGLLKIKLNARIDDNLVEGELKIM